MSRPLTPAKALYLAGAMLASTPLATHPAQAQSPDLALQTAQSLYSKLVEAGSKGFSALKNRTFAEGKAKIASVGISQDKIAALQSQGVGAEAIQAQLDQIHAQSLTEAQNSDKIRKYEDEANKLCAPALLDFGAVEEMRNSLPATISGPSAATYQELVSRIDSTMAQTRDSLARGCPDQAPSM